MSPRQWVGDLKGSPTFLGMLPTVFTRPSLLVYADNGNYFVTGDSLVGVEDPVDACEEVQGLVEVLNGIAELIWPGFEPKCSVPTVRERVGDRIVRQKICTAPKAVLVVGDDGSGVRSDLLESKGLQGLDELRVQIDVRLFSPRLRHALRMFGSQTDPGWPVLCNVLDLVEGEYGLPAFFKRGWMSRSDYKLLRHTANSIKAVGIGARHGVMKWEPPASPMSIERGRRLIRTVLVAWVIDSSQKA